jgi:hypothetical protein
MEAKISTENLSNYRIVDEAEVLKHAETYRKLCPSNENIFQLAYDNGILYKAAELTPLYIVDINSNRVGVTAKELINVTYH